MLTKAHQKWLDKDVWLDRLHFDGQQKVLDTIQEIDGLSQDSDVGFSLMATAITAFAAPQNTKGHAMLATWYKTLPKIYIAALVCLSKSDMAASGVRYDPSKDVDVASSVLSQQHAQLLHDNWTTLTTKMSCPPILKAKALAAVLSEATHLLPNPSSRPHRL